jgi:hypothetical protein
MSNSKLFVYGVDQGCENHEIQAFGVSDPILQDLDPHQPRSGSTSKLLTKASRINLKWIEISKFDRSNDKEVTFG